MLLYEYCYATVTVRARAAGVRSRPALFLPYSHTSIILKVIFVVEDDGRAAGRQPGLKQLAGRAVAIVLGVLYSAAGDLAVRGWQPGTPSGTNPKPLLPPPPPAHRWQPYRYLAAHEAVRPPAPAHKT